MALLRESCFLLDNIQIIFKHFCLVQELDFRVQELKLVQELDLLKNSS